MAGRIKWVPLSCGEWRGFLPVPRFAGVAMFRKLLGACVGLAMMGMVGSANALLIIDGSGNLLGATDILIDGILYDVTFLDGTCAFVYGTCDGSTIFDFNDLSSAQAATAALRDQIFTPTFALFDDQPEFTSGCGFLFFCRTNIVFDATSTIASVTSFGNSNQEGLDVALDGFVFLSLLTDTSSDNIENFAKFTQIPEPSILALFATGLAGLGFMGGRRRVRPG